jgi:hypothetical protein
MLYFKLFHLDEPILIIFDFLHNDFLSLFMLNLKVFLLDEDLKNFFFIYNMILIATKACHLYLFKHIAHALFLKLLQLLILYLLKHTVKPVFNGVFGPTWQLFDDLRPSITYLFSQMKDLKIFLVGERLSVYFWVEEIVPSLPTLLPVSINA